MEEAHPLPPEKLPGDLVIEGPLRGAVEGAWMSLGDPARLVHEEEPIQMRRHLLLPLGAQHSDLEILYQLVGAVADRAAEFLGQRRQIGLVIAWQPNQGAGMPLPMDSPMHGPREHFRDDLGGGAVLPKPVEIEEGPVLPEVLRQAAKDVFLHVTAEQKAQVLGADTLISHESQDSRSRQAGQPELARVERCEPLEVSTVVPDRHQARSRSAPEMSPPGVDPGKAKEDGRVSRLCQESVPSRTEPRSPIRRRDLLQSQAASSASGGGRCEVRFPTGLEPSAGRRRSFQIRSSKSNEARKVGTSSGMQRLIARGSSPRLTVPGSVVTAQRYPASATSSRVVWSKSEKR